MDLQTELERSIGEGPALHPPTAHLERGRRALRRRRLKVGAGVLALLVVAGGGYAVLTDEGPGRDDTRIANGEDAPVDEFLDEVPYGLTNRCDGDPRSDCQPMPVDFTSTGELRRLPGTRIIALALDPALRGEVEKSAGLDVVIDGKRLWVSLEWAPDSGSSGLEPAGASGMTFDEWLARPSTFGGVYETPPEPVETLDWWNDRTGEFQVPEGVTVIRRVDDPVGGEGPEDSAGLVFDFEGKRYWTLTTHLPGADSDASDDVRMAGVTVGEVDADLPGGDFDAWLRDRAAEQRADLRSR